MSASLHCVTPIRDRHNERRILRWVAAWATCWLFALAGVESGRVSAPWLVIGAAALQGGLGLGLALAYRTFLLEADELRRKIELETLALAAGLTVTGSFMLDLLVEADLVPASIQIGFRAVPLLVYSVVVAHRMRSYS